MIIKGNTLYLRTVREADLDLLYEYNCDIEMRGLHFPVYIDSETAFKRMYQEHGFLTDEHGDILICGMDDEILGILVYFKSTPYYNGFEIGYRLFDTGNSGRGIISEALMLCSYILFMWQDINRLELKISPENKGSIRVAEKCGYQFEGVARQCVFLRGKYIDFAIYALLRDEAPKTHAELMERLQVLKSPVKSDSE